MRDIIITLLVFGAVPYIIARPYFGVYVWSWISYMNPHRLSWGFAYNMPFAAITAAALFIGIFVTKDKKNRLPNNPVVYIWLAFIVWVTLSTFTAIDVQESLLEWKRVIKIQTITLLTLILITNKKQLINLVAVIALSVGFFGIKGGVFVIATAGSYRIWGPPGSFIEGNNELALALLMVIPLMWFLRLQVENIWLKRLLLASIVLTLFSVISSYSRGAFLAATVVLGMFWLKSNKKVIIGVALAVIVVVIVSVMPKQYFDRINTIQTYEQDSSAMGRINSWYFAFNLATDHPLTGGGFGTFTKPLFLIYAPDPYDHHDAHSIYFEVLGEQGFVGLFLFLLIWGMSFKLCKRIIRITKNDADLKWANDLAKMTQVSIVAYLVGGAFLGLAYFDLPYHLMTICVLCHLMVENEIKSRENNKYDDSLLQTGKS